MICDKLVNLIRYNYLIEDCDKIVEFFKKNDINTMEDGRHNIPGTSSYFSIFSYKTKLSDTARWETHHNHMDIHYVIKGKEVVEWIPAENLKDSAEYVEERDVEFFTDTVKGSRIIVEPGYFALVMPEDAHKPAIALDTPEEGKKAVFKVKCK